MGPSWLLPTLYILTALLGAGLGLMVLLRRKKGPAAGTSTTFDRASMLLAAYDRNPLGIGFIDSEWNWKEANRKLVSLLGYSLKNELGNLRNLTHPEDRKREAQMFADLRGGKRNGYTITKRLMRKTGEYRTVRVQMLRCAEKPYPLFQCVVDESVHKASQVEMLSSAMAEDEHTAMILCDTSGVITAWNKGAERLYGFSEEEVTGTSWAKLHYGETRESLTRMFANAAQNGFTEIRNQRRRNDDALIRVQSVLVSDMARGEVTGFLEVGHLDTAKAAGNPFSADARSTPHAQT